MSSSLQPRMMRSAISPRFATSTRFMEASLDRPRRRADVGARAVPQLAVVVESPAPQPGRNTTGEVPPNRDVRPGVRTLHQARLQQCGGTEGSGSGLAEDR